VPEGWRWLIAVNPLALFIEMVRGCLIHGAWPDLRALAALWAVALAIAWLGFYGFQRTRRGFADVL
jgi:lipopolysaccharide transport system permease protein